MLRLACIGLGWVAREVWLPRFADHGGFTLVGGTDLDEGARIATQARWPGARIGLRSADILDLDPDLVIVAVPNRAHAMVAEELLSHGRSVLVEKPVCLHADEVERLRAAARTGGGRLFPSRASRLRADVLQLSDFVVQGAVGTVRMIELDWVRARGVPRPGSWFTNRDLAGGGVGVDLGWHLLDVGLGLLGYPAPVAGLSSRSGDHIAAKPEAGTDLGAAAMWRKDSGLGTGLAVDVEDTIHGLLTTTCGTALQLHAAWASHQPVDVTRVTVRGSAGEISLSTTFGFSPNRIADPSLTLTRNGRRESIAFPREELGAEYGRQVEQIAQALRAPLDSGPCADPVFDEIASVVAALAFLQACDA